MTIPDGTVWSNPAFCKLNVLQVCFRASCTSGCSSSSKLVWSKQFPVIKDSRLPCAPSPAGIYKHEDVAVIYEGTVQRIEQAYMSSFTIITAWVKMKLCPGHHRTGKGWELLKTRYKKPFSGQFTFCSIWPEMQLCSRTDFEKCSWRGRARSRLYYLTKSNLQILSWSVTLYLNTIWIRQYEILASTQGSKAPCLHSRLSKWRNWWSSQLKGSSSIPSSTSSSRLSVQAVATAGPSTE